MKDDQLVSYKKAFYVDGSFRDIYIFGTDERDWQRLLAFLRSSSYAIEFAVDDQPTPFQSKLKRFLLSVRIIVRYYTLIKSIWHSIVSFSQARKSILISIHVIFRARLLENK